MDPISLKYFTSAILLSEIGKLGNWEIANSVKIVLDLRSALVFSYRFRKRVLIDVRSFFTFMFWTRCKFAISTLLQEMHPVFEMNSLCLQFVDVGNVNYAAGHVFDINCEQDWNSCHISKADIISGHGETIRCIMWCKARVLQLYSFTDLAHQLFTGGMRETSNLKGLLDLIFF